jgi:hypothetical protein
VSATPDIANARIEFANGCVANITTNRVAFKNIRRFRVFTRNNLVNINLLDKTAEVIKIRNAPDAAKNLVLDPGNKRGTRYVLQVHQFGSGFLCGDRRCHPHTGGGIHDRGKAGKVSPTRLPVRFN